MNKIPGQVNARGGCQSEPGKHRDYGNIARKLPHLSLPAKESPQGPRGILKTSKYRTSEDSFPVQE
jgi:hypothetical protein